MINGAHTIIYSENAEDDREFFQNVLKCQHVDAGEGWLLFALPPAELAVHPAETNGRQELYLMCEDVNAFADEMKNNNIVCTEIADRGWGLVTQITLPGGGRLGVYQSRHARP